MRRRYMNTELAFVTGASSGIGRAIALMLVRKGYHVTGIGRVFKDEQDPAEEGRFDRMVCDVRETGKLMNILNKASSEYTPKILVNAAGVGYYGLHENMTPDRIKEMVDVNLTTPMILSSRFIKLMRENGGGYIFNISSVTACKVNTHGACYGATKAGLSSFGDSVFEEARKHGVKIVNIMPDMTKTNLYRNSDLDVSDDVRAYLLPEDVANAVGNVLDMRGDTVISELKIVPILRKFS